MLQSKIIMLLILHDQAIKWTYLITSPGGVSGEKFSPTHTPGWALGHRVSWLPLDEWEQGWWQGWWQGWIQRYRSGGEGYPSYVLCFIIYYCSQIVGKSLLNFLQPRIPRFLFWNMVPIHSPSCFVFSCPSLEGSWWQWWAHWTACRIADGRHSPWTAFSKVSPGFARGEGATFRMKRKLPNAFQENNWIEFMKLW